jgi:hypothetical protein
MSAVTMKHDYRNSAVELAKRHEREIKIAIDRYLAVIRRAIDDCGGLIHEGNYNLFIRNTTSGGRVVYFYGSWLPYNAKNEAQFNGAVELYSEDGWNTIEDIANWADIAKSRRDKIVAERDKDKKGMSAEEIMDAVASLACSQGSYGRLLEELRACPDALQELVDQKFGDTLEMVLYLEEG